MACLAVDTTPGILNNDRAKLIKARIDYLTNVVRDQSKGSWSDDNSTREACLMLEAQLTALAVGRGAAFSAEQVKGRMKRLQSLLNQAGYNFDESGNEQKWDLIVCVENKANLDATVKSL